MSLLFFTHRGMVGVGVGIGIGVRIGVGEFWQTGSDRCVYPEHIHFFIFKFFSFNELLKGTHGISDSIFLRNPGNLVTFWVCGRLTHGTLTVNLGAVRIPYVCPLGDLGFCIDLCITYTCTSIVPFSSYNNPTRLSKRPHHCVTCHVVIIIIQYPILHLYILPFDK